MALLTVEGIYRDGKFEPTETPAEAPTDARVLVTFLEAPTEADADRKARLRERLLERLRRGIDFGGGPYYQNREELYEDRLRRFEP
jgi:hypothetical protein